LPYRSKRVRSYATCRTPAPWRTSLDPAAEHVEVRATHDTIITDAAVHDLILDRLTGAASAWTPAAGAVRHPATN